MLGKAQWRRRLELVPSLGASGVPFRFFYGLDELSSAPPLLISPPNMQEDKQRKLKLPQIHIVREVGRRGLCIVAQELVSIGRSCVEGHGVGTAQWM